MGKERSVLMVFMMMVVVICSSKRKQVKSDSGGLKCCDDNHIGRCLPSQDDNLCDQLCQMSCNKGGACKVLKGPPPNHFCHCFC
ncbi:hypothetical protein I3842_05G010100 [Carya illinoinensis]|uniref:Uncharacterized protein n=2 Tax=Carya illinoinensis TaxID=32201 RepID=A0A922EZH5_CARIL|nr:hypothetical protein I3842_05G010100 [Carya illinoinensis]KAG6710612.1 hypothetical protein I3842_05G010100 [Carya illinoinensis]KAG6710613.1 hypothetical protein I3842_05G010100 [Carya illinoinensis]